MLKFKCNVCGSDFGEDIVEIEQPDRFELALGVSPEGYRRKWAQCNQCDIAVNVMSEDSKRAVDEVASSYYDIDLGSNSNLRDRFDFVMNLPEGKSDNSLRVDRILSYLSQLPQNQQAIKICDIGCGLGVFPAKLIRRSEENPGQKIEILGIEPDSTSFKFLEELNLFPVIKGFFPQAVEGKRFDLITLNKVLEHINTPLQLMKSVAEYLTEGAGITYVEVPCISNAWLKPKQDNSLGALHCNLYSVHSLSSIFRKAGLTTVMAERIIEPSGKITVYAFGMKV